MSHDDRLRQPAGTPVGGQYAADPNATSAAPISLGEAAPKRSWGRVGLSEGSRTPWGPAQQVNSVAPGIAVVSTASHGGVKLTPERNREIPAAWRRSDGWYEEDCDANIPAYVFAQEFAEDRAKWAHTSDEVDVDGYREDRAQSIREWFPDEWEKVTGETVTAEQSRKRAEQLFAEAHKDDHVAIGASTSEEHPGMVEVITTLGGRRSTGYVPAGQWGDDNPDGLRKFLVPAGEYKGGNGANAFVIDPARHKDITPESTKLVKAKRHTVKLPQFPHREIVDTVGSARADRVFKDLHQRWRSSDGTVRSLQEVIEEEGVTGVHRTFYNGKTEYSLRQRDYEGDTASVSFPISKATFDYLSKRIPSDQSESELAAFDAQKARWTLETAEEKYAKAERDHRMRSMRGYTDDAELKRARNAVERATKKDREATLRLSEVSRAERETETTS